MTDISNLVHVSDLECLRDVCGKYARMGNDYVYCFFDNPENVRPDPDLGKRFSGLTLLLVDKGRIEGTIDDKHFVMGPGSMLVFGRWNSLLMAKVENEEIEVHLLFIAAHFLQDVDIDLNAVNMHALIGDKPSPVLSGLSDNEVGMMRDAMSAMYRVAHEEVSSVYTRNMSRSMVQFLIYALLQIHDAQTTNTRREGASSRQVAYAQEFMRLLGVHHAHSRDIGFYADKLHISPKYLSHLIKEHTGKSASDWIGEFVVREAKNMLRYSNKNVQQVAYALNFSTQSSFGKYFKHITGMSPTEYQKS